MAEISIISGWYCLEEVMGTPAAERERLYETLASDRPAWARVFRKILDSRAPPVEPKAKPAPYKEVGIYATLQGVDALS